MQEYETIGRARAMLKASKTVEPSLRTVEGYEANAKRLMKRAIPMEGPEIDRLIACAKDTQSAATWFSRRAALIHSMHTNISRLLTEQDRLQRELKAKGVPVESPSWESWRIMVAKIGQLLNWRERLHVEPGPAIEERKERHSKRKDMRGLPDNWRERIVARMQKYRHAALVEAVTGCRPDELTRGVRLSIVGGELVAEISGSKVTEKSGQPWRRLSWATDSDSPLVTMLVTAVRGGLELVRIEDAKAYSGAVRAAGAREWPRRRKSLAPYCFRHAAASDMKAGGLDDASISQALGHCADVARSYYGQWQQGSASGVVPKTVAAARPVRETRTEPAKAGKKKLQM